MMGELRVSKKNRGQSLVEVVLAVALAAIIITSLLAAVLSSLNGADNSQTQNEATQYSQQAMEILRTIVPSPAIPQNQVSQFCFGQDSTLSPISQCDGVPNIVQKYIRTVDVDKTNGGNACKNLASVTVKTYWQDGQCSGTGMQKFCRSSVLASCFSNL